jgi:hypothetical protein
MQVYMMMLQKYQFELKDCSHIFSCHKETRISLAKKYNSNISSHPLLIPSVREKYKLIWIDSGDVPVNEKEALWELIKADYAFLLNMKSMAKGLPFLPWGGPFEGSGMHLTSSIFNRVFYGSIGLSSSHQTNGTRSNNCIPLQKPRRTAID